MLKRAEHLIHLMDSLIPLPEHDLSRFENARRIKARIYRGEVSASMSSIEYCEPEAGWIADEVRRLDSIAPSQKD